MMVLLERLLFGECDPELAQHFPFDVPAIRGILGNEVRFDAPVTFLVGENGSGKSTFLEGIACAVALPGIGSDDPSTDSTLEHGRELAELITVRWTLKHPHRGYFFRAEDFFGYGRRQDRMWAEIGAERAAMQRDLRRSADERRAGRAGFGAETLEVTVRYNVSGLDSRSHGEQFLDLFSNRCRPGGLYLMDEPEAPLSPARQLTFISMLKAIAGQGSQFIIATHSPMLLALPGAQILNFDGGEMMVASYDTLEHVQIVRMFLADPDAYLRHL